jgi:hypothetical protein
MLRKLLAGLFCMGLCLSLAFADEFKGKVTKVDPDKKTITVDVDGKDMTFMVKNTTKFLSGKKDNPKELAEGINAKNLKAGVNVVVKTPDGNKTQASEVYIKGGKKKKGA